MTGNRTEDKDKIADEHIPCAPGHSDNEIDVDTPVTQVTKGPPSAGYVSEEDRLAEDTPQAQEHEDFDAVMNFDEAYTPDPKEGMTREQKVEWTQQEGQRQAPNESTAVLVMQHAPRLVRRPPNPRQGATIFETMLEARQRYMRNAGEGARAPDWIVHKVRPNCNVPDSAWPIEAEILFMPGDPHDPPPEQKVARLRELCRDRGFNRGMLIYPDRSDCFIFTPQGEWVKNQVLDHTRLTRLQLHVRHGDAWFGREDGASDAEIQRHIQERRREDPEQQQHMP